jgi:transcription initiation factor TFIID subunit 2
MNAADRKRCLRILLKINSHPAALLFSRPVDPKLDGCPDYYNIIKNPMDLSTIRKKLESNAYPNKDAFAADIRLMINNCFLFNPPGTPVYNQGMQLEDLFDEQWALWTNSTSGNRPEDVNLTIEEKPRVPIPNNLPSVSATTTVAAEVTATPTTNSETVHTTSNQSISTTKPNKSTEESSSTSVNHTSKESEESTMTLTEQTRCKTIINKLMTHRAAGPFLVPVDPVALGIPTYFSIGEFKLVYHYCK